MKKNKRESFCTAVKKIFTFVFLFSILILLHLFMNWISYKYDIKNCFFEVNPSTSISVNFTIMGFAITLKNILLRRDNQTFLNFSIKRLIETGDSFISKVFWYSLIVIPFFTIFLYIRGYEKQLFAYTFISGISIIGYFFDVIARINKTNYTKVISYQIIENLIDNIRFNHSIVEVEYKNEIFSKLCNEKNKGYSESDLVFLEFVKMLHSIILDKDRILKRKLLFWRNTNAKKKVDYLWRKRLSQSDKDEAIKSISIYSFNYFDCIIKNNYKVFFCEDKTLDNLILKIGELVKSFLSESSIYPIIKKSVFKPKQKKRAIVKKREYYLFLNFIMGILTAFALNCKINHVKDMTQVIKKICVSQKVIPNDSVIDAIAFVITYYLFSINCFNNTVCFDDFDEFATESFRNTYERDYNDLFDILYLNFSITDYQFCLKNSFETIIENCEKTFLPNLNIWRIKNEHSSM